LHGRRRYRTRRLKDHFRLRRTDPDGKVEEILLTDSDVLQVATSSLHLQSMVLKCGTQ